MKGCFRIPGTVTHLAVADKIYSILGGDTIKNAPLFFGGNIAPDAIHAKENYQRADKKHSHLCDGIRSYGYGYPDITRLFKDRVNEFIKNYYLTAIQDKDLYLGYIVHILTDELYLLNVYEKLEKHLKDNGVEINRKNIADEVNNDGYREFFSDASYIIDISANQYKFTQDVTIILESVWDYEIKDYITANEINISKRRAIDKFLKSDNPVNDEKKSAVNFIDTVSENMIPQILKIIKRGELQI